MSYDDSNDVIATRGLSKAYGSVVALHGLDLRVPKGSIFGFLGPNGAGKTTTIKLLLGLTRPTSGSASVVGRDVAGSQVFCVAPGTVRHVFPDDGKPYGINVRVQHVDDYESIYAHLQEAHVQVAQELAVLDIDDGCRPTVVLAAMLGHGATLPWSGAIRRPPATGRP